MDPTDIRELLRMQETLMENVPHGHKLDVNIQPSVVAGLGIIEEVMEYLNAIGFKSWRPTPLSGDKQIEELTDILFFYLELVITSNFTWDEVAREYSRKWGVNMERYRKAEEGDYSWDDRAEKTGL